MSLDLFSIIIPVILKFMIKKAAMKTITLRIFMDMVKALRVSNPMMLILNSRMGIMRVKKVTSCVPCMRILINCQVFLLPKTEKDKAMQCSKEMRKSYIMEQSANPSELSKMVSIVWLSMSLNWSGIPDRIFICRKMHRASLETMQNITKQQYFLAVDFMMNLIFFSSTAIRLIRKIWLMQMMRKISRMVTDYKLPVFLLALQSCISILSFIIYLVSYYRHNYIAIQTKLQC